jgi:glycerate kinase
MKFLAIVDSFKGSISSKEAGQLIVETLRERDYEGTSFPISDGGEGFLETIQAINPFKQRFVSVLDPLGREIRTYYLLDEKDMVAYIELALVSGISLIDKKDRNPLNTSTFGLGQLVKDAINLQIKSIVLSIGGSCTNDGGAGLLEALGANFYDQHNEKLTFITGGLLERVHNIEVNNLFEFIKGVKFLTLCDVNNPLLGPNGATYIYGKQKGAGIKELAKLESNMKHYVEIINKMNETYELFPGSGAAGGVGFCAKTFLDTDMRSGIEYVLDMIDYDKIYNNFDFIITGEGKIDRQSLNGKVIYGILKRTRNKKVIVLTGINALSQKELDKHPNLVVYSIVPNIASLEDSLADPQRFLKILCEKIDVK